MVIFWRSLTWILPFGIVRLDSMSNDKSSLNQRQFEWAEVTIVGLLWHPGTRKR